MNATKSQEQSLLEVALRLESESERNTFLDSACASDPGLRRRLDELLAASKEADAFFRDDPLKQAGLVEGVALPAALASPVPEKPGDAIILKEILDKTAQRISNDLTNQPAVEADIRYEVGKIYGALGATPWPCRRSCWVPSIRAWPTRWATWPKCSSVEAVCRRPSPCSARRWRSGEGSWTHSTPRWSCLFMTWVVCRTNAATCPKPKQRFAKRWRQQPNFT